MKVELKPFQTPNYVIERRLRQEGFVRFVSWSLSEVDSETLSEMCDAFRAEIFRKAGKQDPKKEAEKC